MFECYEKYENWVNVKSFLQTTISTLLLYEFASIDMKIIYDKRVRVNVMSSLKTTTLNNSRVCHRRLRWDPNRSWFQKLIS
jgi:hypothetical protein